MKKFIIIGTILAVIIGFVVYFTNRGIDNLPNSESVTELTVESNDLNLLIQEKSSIEAILSSFEDSKKTFRSSNNDQPLVESYITFQFEKSDNTETYYLYTEDDKFYLEKPYDGIYRLNKETYSRITKLLEDTNN